MEYCFLFTIFVSLNTLANIMAKPVKTYYCHEAGKKKMRFETEKKADNFIKFNSEEIEEENGKAPIRSYYCRFCCAWHVTSNPNVDRCEAIAERKIEIIDEVINQKKNSRKNKAEYKPQTNSFGVLMMEEEVVCICDRLSTLINEAKKYLKQNCWEQYLDAIEIIELEFDSISDISHEKVKKTSAKIASLKENYEILVKTDEAMTAIIKDNNAINNFEHSIVKLVIDNEMDIISQLISQNDVEKATQWYNEVYSQLQKLRSRFKSRVYMDFNDLCRKIKNMTKE